MNYKEAYEKLVDSIIEKRATSAYCKKEGTLKDFDHLLYQAGRLQERVTPKEEEREDVGQPRDYRPGELTLAEDQILGTFMDPVNMVEYTLKRAHPIMITSWRQFAPPSYNIEIKQVCQEMVDLWNNKYGRK